MPEPHQCAVRVRLLGPFYLERDGEELHLRAWKSRKALTLFKYLVSRRGQRVPKDVLIELLWPEIDDPEKGSHNLHTVVYFLRQLIEPGSRANGPSPRRPVFIQHSAGLYWFETGDGCWVDIEQFERLCREAQEAEGRDDEKACRLYRQALSLYRGDFCPEDAYQDWAAGPREHFLELYFGAVLRASSLMVRLHNDYTGSISLCRAALKRDPCREELHQAVIAYLIRAGRYGEAAVQYRQCARLLYEEFGLYPSPETQALYEKMKRLASAGKSRQPPRLSLSRQARHALPRH
ncbi:MAG: winged helix-turn-helix domain-containing protein [Firmicutes bacterium]|nr:winged helix-turn-helix domain-containing protein [Bacillota bacterium]